MSILGPNWKYTHSTATDIRKTFEKARQKLPQSKASQPQQQPERKVVDHGLSGSKGRDQRPAFHKMLEAASHMCKRTRFSRFV